MAFCGVAKFWWQLSMFFLWSVTNYYKLFQIQIEHRCGWLLAHYQRWKKRKFILGFSGLKVIKMPIVELIFFSLKHKKKRLPTQSLIVLISMKKFRWTKNQIRFVNQFFFLLSNHLIQMNKWTTKKCVELWTIIDYGVPLIKHFATWNALHVV